jgi:hypothetical protein
LLKELENIEGMYVYTKSCVMLSLWEWEKLVTYNNKRVFKQYTWSYSRILKYLIPNWLMKIFWL